MIPTIKIGSEPHAAACRIALLVQMIKAVVERYV